MKGTCAFKSKHLNLIECQMCVDQYTGSTKTKFRSRANNYKSTQAKFSHREAVPKQTLKQKVFMIITVQIDIMA